MKLHYIHRAIPILLLVSLYLCSGVDVDPVFTTDAVYYPRNGFIYSTIFVSSEGLTESQKYEQSTLTYSPKGAPSFKRVWTSAQVIHDKGTTPPGLSMMKYKTKFVQQFPRYTDLHIAKYQVGFIGTPSTKKYEKSIGKFDLKWDIVGDDDSGKEYTTTFPIEISKFDNFADNLHVTLLKLKPAKTDQNTIDYKMEYDLTVEDTLDMKLINTITFDPIGDFQYHSAGGRKDPECLVNDVLVDTNFSSGKLTLGLKDKEIPIHKKTTHKLNIKCSSEHIHATSTKDEGFYAIKLSATYQSTNDEDTRLESFIPFRYPSDKTQSSSFPRLLFFIAITSIVCIGVAIAIVIELRTLKTRWVDQDQEVLLGNDDTH